MSKNLAPAIQDATKILEGAGRILEGKEVVSGITLQEAQEYDFRNKRQKEDEARCKELKAQWFGVSKDEEGNDIQDPKAPLAYHPELNPEGTKEVTVSGELNGNPLTIKVSKSARDKSFMDTEELLKVLDGKKLQECVDEVPSINPEKLGEVINLLRELGRKDLLQIIRVPNEDRIMQAKALGYIADVDMESALIPKWEFACLVKEQKPKKGKK